MTHVDPAEGENVEVRVGAQVHPVTDTFERLVPTGFGTADAGWKWEDSRQGSPTGSVGNHTGYLPVDGVQGAGVDLSAPITELVMVGRLQDCSTYDLVALDAGATVWLSATGNLGAPWTPGVALEDFDPCAPWFLRGPPGRRRLRGHRLAGDGARARRPAAHGAAGKRARIEARHRDVWHLAAPVTGAHDRLARRHPGGDRMSMIGSPHGEARGLSPCRRAPVAEPAGRTRFRALLVVLACAAVLGACAEHGGRLGFELVNDLGVPVEIVYLGDPEVVAGRLGTEDGDDREVFDFGLTPDPSDPSAARCTTADIVAKSLDGRVLARIPAPVCDMNTLLLSSFPGS